MFRLMIHILWAAMAFCPLAYADEVVLKNGDIITGNIKSSEGDSLTAESEILDAIKIPLEAIESITSDQPLYLVLKEGQTVVGTVTTKEGKFEVLTAEGETIALSRDSIAAIRSSEAQAAYLAEIEKYRRPSLLDLWGGTADIGLSMARGNAETLAYNLGLKAARETKGDKTSVYATMLYSRNSTTGEPQTTANAKRGGIRYNRNITGKIFAFGTGDFESDEFQDLDLRVVLGGGLGWQAKQTDRMTFSLFGGGSFNREYFAADLTRSSGEILIGQEFAYKLLKRMSIDENVTFFPNLSQSGEYRFNFDTTVATEISSWLAWQIMLSDRYLSNPVQGAKSNDFILSMGLRFRFGE
jgi:putative salt-induced outer membrane protein YdiY